MHYTLGTYVGLTAQNIKSLSAAEHPRDAIQRKDVGPLLIEFVEQLRIDGRLDHADQRFLCQLGNLVEGGGSDLRDNVGHCIHLLAPNYCRTDRLVRGIGKFGLFARCCVCPKRETERGMSSETTRMFAGLYKDPLFVGRVRRSPSPTLRTFSSIHVPPASTTTFNPALTSRATLSGVCDTRFSPGKRSLRIPTVNSLYGMGRPRRLGLASVDSSSSLLSGGVVGASRSMVARRRIEDDENWRYEE